MFKTVHLHVLNCHVTVYCEDAKAGALVLGSYHHLQTRPAGADWHYVVGKSPDADFSLRRVGQRPLLAANDSEFLWLFEKDFTIELERRRHDLYFIHSAVVAMAGRACLLVGASGSGKSTLTWGLLHHGCRYLSDELAPVDLHTLQVFPYARALCLKDIPPGRYPLPHNTLTTSHTLHVPVTAVSSNPLPVAALIFVQYSPRTSVPTIRSITTAEAAARLFAQALNPLAHPEHGLDGALTIAARSACFTLESAQLSMTCDAVIATLHTLAQGQGAIDCR